MVDMSNKNSFKKRILIIIISAIILISLLLIFILFFSYSKGTKYIYNKTMNIAIKETEKIENEDIRLLMQGSIYSKEGDYLNASYCYDKLLKKNSLSKSIDRNLILFSAGLSYYKMNKDEIADKYATQLLESDLAKGHLLKAIILNKIEKNKENTIKELKFALENDDKFNTLGTLRKTAEKMLKSLENSSALKP